MSSAASYNQARPQYAAPKITKQKIRQRVSYQLRTNQGQSQRHCFGINSVAIDPEKGHLYSAGRDSTIRSWDIEQAPTHIKCFEHHSDWINDIFLTKDNSKLFSCSSDASIKAWDADAGVCLTTLNKHSDYVKALAYAPKADIFASAGLDSSIYMWDMNTCIPVSSLDASGLLSPLATSTVLSNHGNSGVHSRAALGHSTASSVMSPGFASPLAASSTSVLSASSVLSGSTYLNSSTTGMRPMSTPIAKAGDKGSVYSLGINAMGTLVLSGSTETVVRAWDPRSGQKVFKLKGHRDNIKALIVNPEGTLCITGSSDFTMRLWDIGQQRCVHVYEVHDDSVWSLSSNQNFTTVYSGGRDTSVFATDLSTSKSTLVCSEDNSVLKVLCATNKAGKHSVWVTTTDSSIKSWDIDSIEKSTSSRKSPAIVTSPMLSSSPPSTVLQGPRPTPAITHPTCTIAGRPGIIKHAILNNRRHLLTKDSSGTVELWDVTKGERLQNHGEVIFEDKLEQLTEMISVPNWLSIDTKTGSITVHLDYPQCFGAEVYTCDAGVGASPEDEGNFNIGERVLRALFQHWLVGRKAIRQATIGNSLLLNSSKGFGHTQSQAAAVESPDAVEPSVKEQPPQNGETGEAKDEKDEKEEKDAKDSKEGGKKGLKEALKSSSAKIGSPKIKSPFAGFMKSSGNNDEKHGSPKSSPKIGSKGSKGAAPAAALELDDKSDKSDKSEKSDKSDKSEKTEGKGDVADKTSAPQEEQELPGFEFPPDLSVIISEQDTGATIHRTQVCQLTGAEPVELIPLWVIDCLLNRDFAPRETQKAGFLLMSFDDKELPSLPQAQMKLSAHRLLKMRRISAYVVKQLSLELPAKEETSADAPSGTTSDKSPDTPDTISAEDYIEILCQNKVVPVDVNLATTRAFFWKSGDDMVLQYRLKQRFTSDSKGNPTKSNKQGSTGRKTPKFPKPFSSKKP